MAGKNSSGGSTGPKMLLKASVAVLEASMTSCSLRSSRLWAALSPDHETNEALNLSF